jgi:hypothetical protein
MIEMMTASMASKNNPSAAAQTPHLLPHRAPPAARCASRRACARIPDNGAARSGAARRTRCCRSHHRAHCAARISAQRVARVVCAWRAAAGGALARNGLPSRRYRICAAVRRTLRRLRWRHALPRSTIAAYRSTRLQSDDGAVIFAVAIDLPRVRRTACHRRIICV